MARQKRKGQQIAWWVLCHYKRKEEALNCGATRLGASLFCHRNTAYLLPTGIITYAILKCNILEVFYISIDIQR
jgi:hypothetical protein